MSENLSYEKLMALFQADREAVQADREVAQAAREAVQAAREADQAVREAERERSDREYERAQAEIQKMREDMREHWRETGLRIDASLADMARVVKNVSRQLGGIGNSNGAMAENYFYNSFKKTKKFGHEQFDYVDRNVKFGIRELRDEYDIVLYNGQSVCIIEVKYDAEKKHVAQTLNKAITFRKLFPMYKDFTIYLGLASFVFTEEIEQAALAAGIAVVKQVGGIVVVQGDQMKKF